MSSGLILPKIFYENIFGPFFGTQQLLILVNKHSRLENAFLSDDAFPTRFQVITMLLECPWKLVTS